jgi:hypothetical protein
MAESTESTKSFFQRPEGKTGAIVGLLLAIAGGMALFTVLPAIILLLENTLYATFLAGSLAFIVFLISDKKVRALASYGYKAVMRAITGFIVEIDPIGILKGYLSDLKDSLGNMDKSIANLAGQIRKLKNLIDKNEEERQHSLMMVEQAKNKTEMKNVFILQARQAGRLQKSNLTLQGLLNKMEMLKRVVSKMREAAVFMIQDIGGEVEVKSQERAAIQAGYSAFTSAKKIIAGESDQRELFDQAMEKLADDYAMKVGEIENFMEMSDGFIKGVDLENGVYEADALVQLDEWEKKSSQLLLMGDSTKLRVSDDVQEGELVSSAGEEKHTAFASLFAK